MQDVSGFLRRKGLVLRDYLDDRRAARIDDAHMVRLNYEAFFFADQGARATFLADPVSYCGLLTDPVTKRRFRPQAGGPSLEHDGVVYHFPNWTSYRRFAAEPKAWVLPGWSM